MKMQRIETAPKDGTFIYLIGDSGCTTFPFRITVGRWRKDYRDFWIDYKNEAFLDGGDPPQFWAPISADQILRYNTLVKELKEKQKQLEEIRKERPEYNDLVTKEVEQEWIFTFCADHVYPNGFCAFTGTYMSAREQMVRHFAAKWGFQYPSREKAGINKFGLYEVKL